MVAEEAYLRDKKRAARFLNASIQTVDRLVRSGELAYVKVGNRVRFRPEDLTDFVQRQRVQRAEAARS
jgi:excisionase family DNA binding protein